MPRLRDYETELDKPQVKLSVKIRKKALLRIWAWLKKKLRR